MQIKGPAASPEDAFGTILEEFPMPIVTLHTQFMALAVLIPAVFVLVGLLALLAPYLGRTSATTANIPVAGRKTAKAQRTPELVH
jgi:hypothetical protein